MRRGTLLLTGVVGAILSEPLHHGARAQQTTVAQGPWWAHGEVEVGGRFFLDNPQKNGPFYLNQKSLAKYYEYSWVKPGPFSNVWVSTGSKDGLYQIDLGGKNIGYRDQYYYFDASKAGQHYFGFQWDQTPHLYSTSAQTMYNGVGTNSLTLPGGVSAGLFGAASNSNFTGPGGVQSIINSNLYQTDIGIRRDTGSVEYRWTPTDEWDVRADYSRLHREGAQPQGVVFNNSSSGIVAEVPAPVNDTTQNFGVNAEYAGISPWGKKFNFKLAHNGSIYGGDNSYTVDSPFFDPATPARGGQPFGSACNSTACNPAVGVMSLWPENKSNAFTSTVGVDLPGKSRYMGTTSYTMMRQNDPYLPFTGNGLLTAPINGQPVTNTAALPFTSLNGSIDTILTNNVITTQITPDLKSKFGYQYYGYMNNTADQLFAQWVGTDATIDTTEPKRSIPTSYIKQNGVSELAWTPSRGLTLGAQFGYERYSWTWSDADHTSEYSGKVFGVYKVNSWLAARGSWQYGERRYGTYTNAVQESLRGGWNENYRSPQLANRDQNIGKFQIDMVLVPTITVSPFAGLLLRDYKTDPYGAREIGILDDNSWNAGAEVIWAPTRRTQLMFSYTLDEFKKRIIGGAGTTGPATSTWDSNVNDRVNTFTVALKQNLIEDKLDLKVSYVYSLSRGSWQTVPFFYNPYEPNENPLAAPNPDYPDTRTSFHRLDALMTYRLDQAFVQQMGWKGEALIRVRYAWERNDVSNWQIENMQPYMSNFSGVGGTQTMIWLAGNNPNYNVQLLGASLALKW